MTSRSSDIDQLAKSIRAAQQAYDTGHAVIPDAMFDDMVTQLRLRAPHHPVLNELGGRPSPNTVIKHLEPMLSLQKEYTIARVLDWALRSGDTKFIIQPKLDGVAISVRYVNRKITSIAMRGDGINGDRVCAVAAAGFPVTHTISTLSSWPRTFELRGEFVMGRKIFAEKYAERYMNTRNMLVGALRSADSTDIVRDGSFLVYSVTPWNGGLIELGSILDDERIPMPPTYTATLDSLEKTLTTAVQTKNLPYDIDGWVVKCDSHSARVRLGETPHHPRWSIALKLQGESGTSIVEDIVWEVSRTGTVTPVVVMTPVKLSGAMVRRATLHHHGFFDTLELREGSEIFVTRRGGVIPHVEAVKSPGGGKPFIRPKKCPGCGGNTIVNGLFLVCMKDVHACPGQMQGAIEFWFKTIGALGFGPDVVKRMMEVGYELPDFYDKSFSETDFAIAGIGQKRAVTLLGEIERTRTMTEATFLHALGIEHVGKTTAERIMNDAHFSVEDLFLVSLGTPVIDRIKVTVGARFNEVYQSLSRVRGLANSLMRSVVFKKESTALAGPLTGMSVVFTGALSDMDRETARQQARELGAETPNAVTKQITHLVVGDGARDAQQGKREKAARYNAKGANIKILSESQWTGILVEAMKNV